MSNYNTIHALRKGETVTVNGKNYRMVEGKAYGDDLTQGDLYIGERNTGPHVNKMRVLDHASVYGSEGFIYAYNYSEVVGVEEV